MQKETMNEDLEKPSPHLEMSRQRLTLAQYVHRQNGVPLGAPRSLQNMLYRSFGAGTLAGFWQYWNPVWGYGLGKYVYSPFQRNLPSWLALILTFVVSGGLHDLVIMAIRQSAAFIFTPWFFLLGVGVVIGRTLGIDFSGQPWGIRAGINLTYLVACFGLMLLAKRILEFP
jgi:hypothetical protein